MYPAAGIFTNCAQIPAVLLTVHIVLITYWA